MQIGKYVYLSILGCVGVYIDLVNILKSCYTYKGEILIEGPSDQIKNMAEDNYESVDEKIVLFLLRPGMYLGRNCNHTNLDMKAVQMYKYT